MDTFDYDVIVIGSGFGGGVTALRLTEKGYRVGVIEAGRRFAAADFPRTNWNLRRFLFAPRLGLRGILRITWLDDAVLLSGAGVGGGSLVWANTCYEPHPAFYADPQWSDITDWKEELTPFFDQAKRMLGVVDSPTDSPSDLVLKDIASHFGVEDTYRPTPVSVHFGTAGREIPDPYFGGAGPTRTGCISCGGCMVGCRHNAKNTIDVNYLYLAERHGAALHAEREVVDVRPLENGGFRLDTRRSGGVLRKRLRTYTAGQVVFCASALGTTRLLLALKEGGSLPGLSGRVGSQVRTNSEALVGAVARRLDVDYSTGPAITSSIHPEPHTHVEVVRYPAGSNMMGLLATILVDGGGRIPRPLRFVLQALRRPLTFLRSLSVRRWSQRSVILLVMQSLDNSLRLFLKRGRLFTRLASVQEQAKPIPTYIPVAHEAARRAAAFTGGDPVGTVNDALLDIPMSAHAIGGACIGSSADRGVIDGYQRVYGYPGLHVADGSALSANLGVNPSLTIAAMSERAMALWPNKGDPDPRPPLGEAYRRVTPVRPRRPAVPEGAPAELRY